MQYLGYLSVRRYNLVNSFSTVYPVVFKMPSFMPHGMPVYASSRLLLWCALFAFVSSCVGVMRHNCYEDAYCRERAAFVGCSFICWSRICDVAPADVDWHLCGRPCCISDSDHKCVGRVDGPHKIINSSMKHLHQHTTCSMTKKGNG